MLCGPGDVSGMRVGVDKVPQCSIAQNQERMRRNLWLRNLIPARRGKLMRLNFASNGMRMTMTGNEVLVGLLAVGVLTGLRTMTPIAVLCWMTVLGRIPAAAGWMGFVRNWISIGVFSLAAIGELIGDKLPMTPSRLKAPGLIARMVFGGLCAAILAAVLGVSIGIGVGAGVAGSLVGSYCGWFLRRRCVGWFRCPDWPVAIVEDLVAVGGSVVVYSLLGR